MVMFRSNSRSKMGPYVLWIMDVGVAGIARHSIGFHSSTGPSPPPTLGTPRSKSIPLVQVYILVACPNVFRYQAAVKRHRFICFDLLDLSVHAAKDWAFHQTGPSATVLSFTCKFVRYASLSALISVDAFVQQEYNIEPTSF
ncbi:uncharacterized protein EV420DRAFT_656072 [Desarmillaria tabescens]|uniref:Uncharacterized protein n=1 Tax=Armillaria tabescens TaxID=1929756 RepID=A0AA39NJT4_ARMTA|nr:uncharacterized protein EV420DRAFT_656072 [Desarmillaria tabescens]KAK0466944.1 hypothetical protein EV420DRAFT_656072 [Desarmillaria tabescens]